MPRLTNRHPADSAGDWSSSACWPCSCRWWGFSFDSSAISASPPARWRPCCSSPALLNHTDYDSAGNPFRTTDPRDIATVNSYDLLGRTTQTVIDWNGGSVTSSTNQTTQFAYDADNNLTLQTAVMPSGTNNQQTAYIFGVSTTCLAHHNLWRKAA